MEYRLLGRTGVRVSPLCLGTANFADPTPEDESARIVDAAIDAGINLIDTGDSYANGEAERFLGRALAANGRRDDVLIATKMHFPMGPGRTSGTTRTSTS
jgi:1-deoxyxylulose-5-phosphate synthase